MAATGRADDFALELESEEAYRYAMVGDLLRKTPWEFQV